MMTTKVRYQNSWKERWKKYQIFNCYKCGNRWTSNSKSRILICKYCSSFVPRNDYYRYFCSDCQHKWKKYVIKNTYSKCRKCNKYVQLYFLK